MNAYPISIIIPIYNTEKFIEKCILSVCQQTLSSFEIILVDDNSPDNAMEKAERVLELYPERIKSTRFIRLKKNVGSASARKLAFKQARGAYIACLDSDDYLELDALEKMLDEAIRSKADIVICDYYMTYLNREKIVIQKAVTETYLEDLLLNKLHGSFWNKLYKKELLNKITILDNVNMCEDLLFSVQSAIFCSKVSYLNKAFLHYVQYNNSSYTSNYSHKSISDIISVLEFITKLFSDMNLLEKYRYQLSYRKLYSKFIILCNSSGEYRKQFFSLYENECSGHFSLPFYYRIVLFFAKIRSGLMIDLILYIKNKVKIILGVFK